MTHEEHLYIYGVIPRPEGAGDPLSLAPLTGLHGARPELIPAGDIAAVASRTPTQSFEGCPKDELLGLFARHQRVNQELIARTALVPFVFGAVADSTREVIALIGKAGGQVAGRGA